MSLQSASDSGATSGGPTGVSFESLPYELRQRIIEQACDSVSWEMLDRKAVLSLMLVSRDVYGVAAARWYRVISVGRPSTLAALVGTVVAKPALGRLVRSLHLGPEYHLPRDWWPMLHLRGSAHLFNSPTIGTSLKKQTLLPHGCEPGQRWLIPQVAPPPEVTACSGRETAIFKAINAAQSSIDVDLRHPERSAHGSMIGSSLWMIRVMEVQAALDAYLTELRRREDEFRQSRLPEYPPLVLTTTMPPSSPANRRDQARPFFLHRTQLLDQLFRRFGSADYFDHPLLLERSGIPVMRFTARGSGLVDQTIWQLAEAMYSSATPSDDPFARLSMAAMPTSSPIAHDLISSLDAANFPTATVGGNLALARTLLGLTPNLRSLCIHGFLQRLLCGNGAAVPPPSLRCLALGPFSSFSDESLSPFFEDGRYANLESLVLRGCFLGDHKCACLAALPQLKNVDWGLHWSDKEPSRVVAAIKPLLGAASAEGHAAAAKAPSTKRTRLDSDADELARPILKDKGLPTFARDAEPAGPYVRIWMNHDTDVALRPHLAAAALVEWRARRVVSHRPYSLSLNTQWGGIDREQERWDLASQEVAEAYEEIEEKWHPEEF